MNEGYIDFRVNMGNWKAMRKADVQHDIESVNELALIAQATQGVDALIESSLRELVKLEKVDETLNEALREKEPGKALSILTSRKFGQTINEITNNPAWQAKEQKEVQQFIRLYATRKMLTHFGWRLNYGKSIESGPITRT